MRGSAVIVGCALLLAACGPSGVRLGIDDAVLLNPDTALASAEEAFTSWLGQTPASHEGPRCYFEALPHEGRADDRPVGSHAWCGPVLSLDHDARYPWSLIEFATEPDAGGRLMVSATGDIQVADTTPRQLLLADGTSASIEGTDLDYPEPAPLEPGYTERLATVYRLGAEAPLTAAAMFALHDGDDNVTHVTLQVGLVESVGEARARRVAPDGHELLLLEVKHRGPLQLGGVLARLELDGTERPLDVDHPLSEGQTLAVVPEDSPLLFTIFQAGVQQQFDLRSGNVDRDPRAQRALDVGVQSQRLDLKLDASWTETTSYEDFFGNVYTYDGRSYQLDGSCETATVSPFDRGWAPEGKIMVEVSCSQVTAGFSASLSTRALELSGRLDVDGSTLEPVSVEVDESQSWRDDVGVRYRFEAPVTATTATFVFRGHADIGGRGLTAFAPAASARINLDGGEGS